MNKYKKLGKNTSLFLIGNFAQKIMGFVFVPIYTAILSTEEYGVADLIVTIVSMVWPFFSIVIVEAGFRFLLDKDEDKEQVISIAFWINFYGTCLMLVMSPVLLFFSILKEYYGLFVIYYILFSIDSFMTYTTRGLEKINDIVIGGIINTFTTIFCNILFLVFLKWGIRGYLLSFIIGMIISNSWYIVRTRIIFFIHKPSYMDKKLVKKMIAYSLPLIPNSISWWVSNSSDRILVTLYCGAAINGIYSVAYKIPSILSVISSVFVSAWQISAVDNFGSEENRKFFSDVYKKYSVINIVLVSCIIVFVKLISRILFSKDFFAAYQIAPYLLVGAVFRTMSGFLGTIYTTAKKTKMIFYSTLIGAIINIVLNIVLIQFFGAIGAAIATLMSYFVVWIIRYVDTRKIIKLQINIMNELFLYFLLSLQIILWMFDSSYVYIAEFLLFGIILIIERMDIYDVLLVLFRMKKKKDV